MTAEASACMHSKNPCTLLGVVLVGVHGFGVVSYDLGVANSLPKERG